MSSTQTPLDCKPKRFFNRRIYKIFLYLLLYSASVIAIIKIHETRWLPPKKKDILENPKAVHLEHPFNIPKFYLHQKIKPSKLYNDTCAVLPKLFNLKFTTVPWQKQETSIGTFHLFSAYYDNRGPKKKLRIIAMFNQIKPKKSKTFHCQLWYYNFKDPTVVLTKRLLMLWSKYDGIKYGKLHPYIITCPLPEINYVPMSVSLVEKRCDDASNNLRIIYPRDRGMKKNFVVCVKGLNFPYKDISARLIEWIELVLILGAEKINFYTFNVHPQIEKVLKYYIKKSRVEVVPITLVGRPPYSPYLHEKTLQYSLQEVIPYNDCLYKHLNEFKFLVLLDIDEIIVPFNGTWVTLMEKFKSGKSTSVVIKKSYFLKQLPEWSFEDILPSMYMLQHVFKLQNYSDKGFNVKGFHDIEKVVGLRNHFPVKCLGRCKILRLEPEVAHLQDYKTLPEMKEKSVEVCRNVSVMDKRIWNFKDKLTENVKKVIKELHFV